MVACIGYDRQHRRQCSLLIQIDAVECCQRYCRIDGLDNNRLGIVGIADVGVDGIAVVVGAVVVRTVHICDSRSGDGSMCDDTVVGGIADVRLGLRCR